jgi:hypothetical protein
MSRIESNLALMNHFVNVANKKKCVIGIVIMIDANGFPHIEDGLSLGPELLGKNLIELGGCLLKKDFIQTKSKSSYNNLNNN